MVWRPAVTKTQKQKDRLNLTPTQLLQKPSREEKYPRYSVGFSAPETNHLEMCKWSCPDL